MTKLIGFCLFVLANLNLDAASSDDSVVKIEIIGLERKFIFNKIHFYVLGKKLDSPVVHKKEITCEEYYGMCQFDSGKKSHDFDWFRGKYSVFGVPVSLEEYNIAGRVFSERVLQELVSKPVVV